MIILWFLLLLTVIVFVHEMGHYLIARFNGVKVEVFSIGFGKELFGINDKYGTRWKICLIPLGGYVKFYGDANLSSNLPDDKFKSLSEKEINETFHIKSLKQKAAIVFAGPLANFIFAFLIFLLLFLIKGAPSDIKYYPIVDSILEDSSASKAGFEIDDKIIMINGKQVDSFLDIRDIIISNPSKKINFKIIRNGNIFDIIAIPNPVELIDENGD